MTALAAVCLLALGTSLAGDLFAPRFRDMEVWLGLEVRGAAARWSAPLHWALFAVGAWAAWTARRWVVPWAAAYLFYVALSHLVWSEASAAGRGWRIGALQAGALSALALLLLRAWRSARHPG